MKQYWITPPDLYSSLDAEFHFDFDPCPCPRPSTYDSLVLPWGKSNYVNPPFNKKDAPYGGPSAFVRKAIAERDAGHTSVFVLPLPWNLGLLMAAGAEIRYGGIVRWLDVATGKPCPRRAPQVIAIIRPQGRNQQSIRDAVLRLRTEVNCRIEHGAESGGHLDYVQAKLDEILQQKGGQHGQEE